MVEINDLERSSVDTHFLKKLGEAVLAKEGKRRADLSVALVGEKRMRELNRMYRRKDEPANVLAFPAKDFGLGELVLCPQKIKKDARKYGITFRKELMYIFIHGILHLVGHNHKKKKDGQKMMQKEKKYLSLFR